MKLEVQRMLLQWEQVSAQVHSEMSGRGLGLVWFWMVEELYGQPCVQIGRQLHSSMDEGGQTT